MKQPNLLAKWCQVELAKCELCQKENLHLAKKILASKWETLNYPNQKFHSLGYLGAI